MSRKPRFVLPGVPQHVIQRGNNREPCFYSNDDYVRYLEDLHDAAVKNHAVVHAYVLMTNHVHLLVTPAQPHSIAHMMQDLGRKYVRYINQTYQRTGTLWQGRYKASLVDSEAYLLTCMRYIEMNPVRAGMVEHPGEYRWSSYVKNTQGDNNALITHHPVYDSLGKDSDERCYAYGELFRHYIGNEQVHEIREALNKELVLGRDDFKDNIELMLHRQTRAGLKGRPRIEESNVMYYVK